MIAGLSLFGEVGFSQGEVVRFSKDFKFCVATAGHQIEGQNSASDWWEWEKIPGKIKTGEHSGRATDHLGRLEEDVQLLNNIGVQQYRMSLEWARLEPTPGVWNEEAFQHYERELKLLTEGDRKIEPLITLNHFTLPAWVQNQGGWESPETVDHFLRYVREVDARFGKYVQTWTTFNEPMVLVFMGHLMGTFPPGKKDPQAFSTALINILFAHAKSYKLLHESAEKRNQKVAVGFAHHLRVFEPSRFWHPVDRYLAGLIDQGFNWAVPDALRTGTLSIHFPNWVDIEEEIPGLKGSQDYVGINYYTREHVRFNLTLQGMETWFSLVVPESAPRTDFNWEIYPQGMMQVLTKINKKFPELPIMILENGISDSLDIKRRRFLVDHLKVVAGAIEKGLPIKNYCYWTLMDNFEWTEGYSQRFGLYEVDPTTLQRSLRESGEFFKSVTHNFGFVEGAPFRKQPPLTR